MKKFLGLTALVLGFGFSQANARAGISFGISIGDDHHRHQTPVVVAPPVAYCPPVISCPPVVPCPPRVVVVDPCASHGHYYRGSVRYCERGFEPRHYRSHRDDRWDRHDRGSRR